jgi:hypothetical protein
LWSFYGYNFGSFPDSYENANQFHDWGRFGFSAAWVARGSGHFKHQQ